MNGYPEAQQRDPVAVIYASLICLSIKLSNLQGRAYLTS